VYSLKKTHRQFKRRFLLDETKIIGLKRKNNLIHETKIHLLPDVYITNNGDKGYAATCGEETFTSSNLDTATVHFLLTTNGEWE